MKLISLIVALTAAKAFAQVPPPPQRAVPYSEAQVQYIRCGLKKDTPATASCGRETAIEAQRAGRSGTPISIPYSTDLFPRRTKHR